MKISHVLRIGLAVMLAIIGLQSALTYYFASTNVELIQEAVERDFDASLHIARISLAANKIRRYEKEYFIYVQSPSKRAEYSTHWEGTYAELKQLLQTGLDTQDPRWSEEDRIRFDQWDQALETYARGFRNVVRSVESSQIRDPVLANSAIRDAKNRFRVVLHGAAEGGRTRYQHARENVERIETNNDNAIIAVGAAVAISIAFALFLLLAMPRSIARSVGLLSDAAESMSRGKIDLTIPVERTNREFRGLAQTLERMRVSQKVLMDRMRSR